MNTNHRTPPRRRGLLLGPGSVMSLVAALYLVGSGWAGRSGPGAANAGAALYRADSRGRLQRVETLSAPASPVAHPPLWKPDVADLEGDMAALRLTAQQRTRITALIAAWAPDRTALTAETRRAMSIVDAQLHGAPAGRHTTVAQIQQGLADYAALSRTYDARRADGWQRAMAALTPAQRATAESVSRRAQGALR